MSPKWTSSRSAICAFVLLRSFSIERGVEPNSLLEQVFDSFARALEYFASSFHGADSDVLPGFCRALAQVGRRVDGMKRHQVFGGLSRSFSRAAKAFRGALANISRSDVCAKAIPARQTVARSKFVFI